MSDSTFVADDTRLATMHGYAPVDRRAAAFRLAFATVRREVWARRELALRYITDAGENWTIA